MFQPGPGMVARLVEDWAGRRPDFPVLTFENGEYPDEKITYRDIVTRGSRLARILLDNGIGQGDIFALVMRNHPEFVYAFWAASAIGAILVPIDPRSKASKVHFQLADSGAKGVIFTNELYDEMKEVLALLPELRVIGVVYKDGFETPVREEFPNLNAMLSEPAAPETLPRKSEPQIPLEIIYTSGTTGNPKGVRIKEERLPLFILLAREVWRYTEQDVLYTGLSLSHGNAQAVTLVPALALGIPAVFSRRFTKSRIWDICRRYGCTTFSLLGGMMMGIYSEPPRPDDADNPVRVVISAGTPPAIWRDFEKRFNVQIHEWYGAVEGGFAHNPPGVGPVGSFGKPLEGLMEMKVVREDDTECEPGEIGELVCRLVGAKTEVEYHRNPAASEEKTRGGWLRTGDMCYRDADGWFYFVFREGGGLRRQGEFIQPDYVEKVIAEHPDVCDVCVYGIPAASGAPGESDLVAAVVPFPGRSLDPWSVFETCLRGLERNAVPSYLQVVEEIPKTASERNLDRLLREAFAPDAPGVYRFEDFLRRKQQAGEEGK